MIYVVTELTKKTTENRRNNPRLWRNTRIICIFCAVFIVLQGCSLFLTPDKPHRPRHRHTKKIKKRRKRRSTKSSFIWPVKGTLTSKFGMRNGNKHDGIDISAPKGTKIVAAATGKIIFSGWGPKGYGKMIIIKHSSKYLTVYAHNSKNIVSLGDKVKKGKTIGYVGETGRTTGPHLHYELRKNLMSKDPLLYLPKRKKIK